MIVERLGSFPLSKSDFQIASNCSKKLVYKKSSFETMNDANEDMEMLAQGGRIVAKYAQLTFPIRRISPRLKATRSAGSSPPFFKLP